MDGTQSLSAAHDIAGRLEEAVRGELGPAVEVETHIEPLPTDFQPLLIAIASNITKVPTVSGVGDDATAQGVGQLASRSSDLPAWRSARRMTRRSYEDEHGASDCAHDAARGQPPKLMIDPDRESAAPQERARERQDSIVMVFNILSP